jgi:hypothetical protein
VPQKRDLVLKQELFSGLAFETDVINIAYKEAEAMLDLTQSAGYKRLFSKAEKKGSVISLQRALMDVLCKFPDRLDPKIMLEIAQIYDPELLHQLLLAASTDKTEFYRILESN